MSSSTTPAIGKDTDLMTRLLNALRTLDPREQGKRLSQGRIPCSRKSLLLGMATGAGFLGIGLVARRGFRASANWGVGSCCFVSVVTFQTCRMNREAEIRRMKTVIEGFAGRKGKAMQGAPEA